MEDKTAFTNIDYINKTVPTPLPDKINDIDTKNSFYDNIIETSDNSTLDMNTLNSFSNVSRSRNEVYNLLDLMGEDPIISSALEIYASDACETNDRGQVVWAESDDDKCLNEVTRILDSINIDKNSYGWMYSLIKYGDLYLRLFRNSEYNADTSNTGKKEEKRSLNEDLQAINEDVILKIFSKNDRYAEYLEMVKNPAEVFNLTRFGKSYGFLRTHLYNQNKITNDIALTPYENNMFNYQFKSSDVDIYAATEFVHATLDDNSDRVEEEVSITTSKGNGTADEEAENSKYVYSVKRGQSILYNSFKIWRELSLLENSVLLNRLTKSSLIRTVSVEVGDMEKTDVRNLLQRIKGMIEQKSAINTGKSLQEYTNPGPIDNVIYIPTHDGKGAITTSSIGGDTDTTDKLVDLNYWKKKLFASLGIPGQYLGDTDDSTGFNGGTSLSLISSRYAKTIKRIQNAYIQAITDAVNLMLLDKGLVEYINKFTIRMQAPTTQEEKDRRDNAATQLNNISSIMSLLNDIEDQKTKLEILKSLLATVVNDANIITSIQKEIDKLESGDNQNTTDDLGLGGESEEMNLNDEMGFEEAEIGEEEPIESEPLEIEAEENFYTNPSGEVLNEESDDLPSFKEMGVSFTDIK